MMVHHHLEAPEVLEVCHQMIQITHLLDLVIMHQEGFKVVEGKHLYLIVL